jgi:hypothetical protein
LEIFNSHNNSKKIQEKSPDFSYKCQFKEGWPKMMEGFSFELFSHLASSKILLNIFIINYRQFGYVTKLTPQKKIIGQH